MRQEIQGLRAVAVLLVLLFHLWPDRVPGGYVGVDVFFVISGFLITSLLLREVDRTGSVSLAGFWARRLRRLLPAAYVVLVASAVGVRARAAPALGAVLRRDPRGGAVRRELDARDQLGRLPRSGQLALTGAALLDALGGGAVLPGVAAARAARAVAGDPRSRQAPGDRAALFGVLATTTLASLGYSLWITATNPARRLLRHTGAGLGVRRRGVLAFAPAAARHSAHRPGPASGWVAWSGLLACSLVLDESTPMPVPRRCWVVAASLTLIWVEAPGLRGHRRTCWCCARLAISATSPTRSTCGTGRSSSCCPT